MKKELFVFYCCFAWMNYQVYAYTPIKNAIYEKGEYPPKTIAVLCDEEHNGITDKNHQIDFGDAINIAISAEENAMAQWRVFPQSGVNKTSGTGSNTGQLIFSRPGSYKVIFDIPAHGDHVAISDTAFVEVSAVKMTFLLQEAILSNPVIAGKAVDGTTLTIPVKVEMYEMKEVTYSGNTSKSIGVHGIKALLLKETTLKNGVNKLTFILSGTPATTGKFQLGFFDLRGKGSFYNYLIAE